MANGIHDVLSNAAIMMNHFYIHDRSNGNSIHSGHRHAEFEHAFAFDSSSDKCNHTPHIYTLHARHYAFEIDASVDPI